MKKVFKWVRDHVRPYSKYNKPELKKKIIPSVSDGQDDIDDLKERVEVGIKFRFKF